MRNKRLALVCCNSIYYNNHRQTHIIIIEIGEENIGKQHPKKSSFPVDTLLWTTVKYIFVF